MSETALKITEIDFNRMDNFGVLYLNQFLTYKGQRLEDTLVFKTLKKTVCNHNL